jgi:hypothetical protein
LFLIGTRLNPKLKKGSLEGQVDLLSEGLFLLSIKKDTQSRKKARD